MTRGPRAFQPRLDSGVVLRVFARKASRYALRHPESAFSTCNGEGFGRLGEVVGQMLKNCIYT